MALRDHCGCEDPGVQDFECWRPVIMNPSWASLARLWRTVHHGRNSLARPSDRFEAALLTCAVLVALAALPVTATVGSETYARQQSVSEQQLSTRFPATATLLADGPPIDDGSRGAAVGNPAPTEASWILPNGNRRSGKVPASQGTLAGTTVPIWLDQSGNPVDAPLSHVGAVAGSVGVGLGLWLGLCVALAALCWLVRSVLDRFRFVQWQQEWFRVEERWTSS
jgi:hypothetical protein